MASWIARLAFIALGSVSVCNIPVFRYALERWPAAPYDVIVFHETVRTPEIEKAFTTLRESGANLLIEPVDLAKIPKSRQKLWEQLNATGPRAAAGPGPGHPKGSATLVALYPDTEIIAWSAPLTAENAKDLVHSPARKEIVKRLLEGESSVWVFLDGGDRAKDDAAAALLEAELRKLEKSLKLPSRAEDDPPILSPIPVRISFSVLRIRRDAPGEKAFVEMLLRSDPGIEGPVVFPIFGRGRALWAITGKGLNEDTISEAGIFLTSACSCEAKELNPGLDLLMAAEWEGSLLGETPPPPLPKFEAPAIKPGKKEEAPPAKQDKPIGGGRPLILIGAVIAGFFVLVTGIRLFRR